MQSNRNVMPLTARNLLLLTPLLAVTAAQAEPSEPPLHGVGSVVFTPAARPHLPNLDPRPSASIESRSSLRYGSGYDARHGIDAETMNRHDSRMEGGFRSQQPASGSGGHAGAGRGGRGR